MKRFLRNVQLFTLLLLGICLLWLLGLIVYQQKSLSSLPAGSHEGRYLLQARYRLAGDILSRDGVALASSASGLRSYAEDLELQKASLHIVGDYSGILGGGLERTYQSTLLGNDRSLGEQMLLDFQGKGIGGDDLFTTLDSRLQKTALQGLGPYRGAVVMLNYHTGEILAMVSTPTLDIEQLQAFEDIPDTSLLNRPLQAQYAPGSTFKMITSAAYLQGEGGERGDPARRILCTAQPFLPGGVKEIYGHGHGEPDLQEAFAESCNLYFGTLGVEMGVQRLQQMAERLGWNQAVPLGRLPVAKSVFSCPDFDQPQLSWASIGQPVADVELRMTPLQLAMQTAIVAREGESLQPVLVVARRNPEGDLHWLKESEELGLSRGRDLTEIESTNLTGESTNSTAESTMSATAPSTESGPWPLQSQPGRPLLEAEVAREEKALLKGAVAEGLIQNLAISGLDIGGKSGTAEVAGQEAANGLLTCFVDSPAYPVVVSVVMENQGSGAAGPLRLSRQLLLQLLQLYPEGLMPSVEEAG